MTPPASGRFQIPENPLAFCGSNFAFPVRARSKPGRPPSPKATADKEAGAPPLKLTANQQ